MTDLLPPENPAIKVSVKPGTAHSSSSQASPIVEGALMLGPWQRIFFCELDRSRQRKVFIQVIGE
jgi:thiamine phosphate synthase YjbQ (UPF0047 family)